MGLERTIYEPIPNNDATTPSYKGLVLFAHGAGAGNKHDFMVYFATKISEAGYKVVTFNFPYMQLAYELDKRRPPNKVQGLIEHFQAEVDLILQHESQPQPIVVMGKSMGGRIASLLDHTMLTGIIALGYPFSPPGKPEKLTERTSHFKDIELPMLIVQGERDSFGGKELKNSIGLPAKGLFCWLSDGDHSFKPRKSSGVTEKESFELAIRNVINFIDDLTVN